MKPKKRRKISAVEMSKNNPSLSNILLEVAIGRISAVPPKINPRLKIFEPITFPRAKLENPFKVAFKLTISSGADVANETTVIPIIILGIENLYDKSTEDLVSKSPP